MNLLVALYYIVGLCLALQILFEADYVSVGDLLMCVTWFAWLTIPLAVVISIGKFCDLKIKSRS